MDTPPPAPVPPATPPRASWREFWNADTPIYVSERHKWLHYRGIAADLVALMDELGLPRDAAVLDHGSGEALGADRVAARCGRLFLCDGAPLVRERLAMRFAGEAGIQCSRRRRSPTCPTPRSISSWPIPCCNTSPATTSSPCSRCGRPS